MEMQLNLLVIDDSVDDRMLYRRALTGAFGKRLNLTEEASGDNALDAIEHAEPLCVLLDYSLPGRNGIEVLKRIRAKHKHLAVVLLTGQGNEDIAVRAMKEGAQDYITKATITSETLSHVVHAAIEHGAMQRRIDEQHEALEIFTNALAHDLKEPVRTICSFAHMICQGKVAGAEQDEYMRHIRDAGDRMGLLIDSVLSYTQLDGAAERKAETVNLNEAVEAAKANLAAQFRERGTTFGTENLPDIAGNRIEIIQVLQNLMSNAVSHSPTPVHIWVCAAVEDDTVRVSVRDNGPGIAPEQQRRIFEPFRRLSRDNAHCGLGLAICRKIVEAHGGKIECESDTGLGASFFFTLPGAAALGTVPSAKEPIAPTLQPTKTGALAHVLLVDDRDDDILFTRALLTGPIGMRCNLVVARDGEEALTAMRIRVGKNDAIDLVLLDINMPVMNGFEMLEAMRDDPDVNRIPVVMCSGSTRESDKNRSRALGAIGYLAKPVHFEQLKPIIAMSSGLCLAPAEGGPPVLLRVA
jgi:signal transduction histidine kinase